MAGQNIVSVGFDVAKLTAEKQEVLAIFTDLFTQLNKYDGTKITPVIGGGLTELNTAIKASNELITQLNANIENLNSVVAKNNTINAATAKSTQASTAATKAQTQSTDELAKAKERLQKLTSQEAVELAKTRVEIAERLRLLKTEAQETNNLYQQRISQAQNERQIRVDQRQQEKAFQDQIRESNRQKKEAAQASQIAAREAIMESKITKQLTDDYSLLKQALKDKEIAYGNLYINKGKDAPETKAALKDIKETQKVLTEVEAGFGSTGKGFEVLGKTLTKGLSALRTIAYVLPGIGIAGIFNLAFEGLKGLAEELDIFSNKEEEAAQKANSLNQAILTLLQSEKALNDVLKTDAAFQNTQGDNINKLGQALENIKAGNKNQGESLKAQLDLSTNIFLNAQAAFEKTGGFTTLDSLRGDLIGAEANYRELVERNRRVENTLSGGDLKDALEQHKKEEDAVKVSLDLAKEKYNQQREIVDAYSSVYKKHNADIIALDTFTKAEQVKLAKETALTLVEIDKNKNDLILKDERSSLEKRVSAIQKIAQDQKRNVDINLTAYLQDPSISKNDRTIAEQKASADKGKITKQADFDIFVLREQFRVRDLHATLDIQNQIQEGLAKTNEDIYKDETQSLDKRLFSLSNYIQARKEQINNQYIFEKSLTLNRFTTDKEKQEIDSKRNSALDVVTANTQNDIRDIIKTYGSRLFKDIKDANKDLEQGTAAQEEFVTQLSALNDQLEKGTISWKKYKAEKEKAVNSFTLNKDKSTISADRNILNSDISLANSLGSRVDDSTIELDAAEQSKDELAIKNAKAKLDALSELYSNANEQVIAARKKLADDEAKYEDDKNKAIEDGEKILAANRKQILIELFNTAKAIADGYYQHQEELIQRNIELVNKQYDNEIQAVNKSSLTQKDKIALDIQLSAQKRAADDAAEKKIRKDKHDNAVIDRDLAIANIIWSTERAVVNALATLPFPLSEEVAWSYGALGALALTKAAATPVPSYFAGTPDGGHPGGIARYGEIGPELVKEPNKAPYIVDTETIGYLPKFTEIIPMYNVPAISTSTKDDSWAQTKFLANQMRRNNKEVKQTIVNNINIDFGFEEYKAKLIYGL